MEQNEDNPYQAPQATSKLTSMVVTRPNTVDWICAILLGLLAISVAFPTTCAGGVILLLGVGGLHGPDIFGQLVLLGSIGLSIAAGIWAVRLYIGAVKKGEANRVAIASTQDKRANESIKSIRNDD